jgi:hypothetical protein
VAAIVALASAGCLYGFSGGGGFPSHIRTVYVESFDNETPQFQLETELFSRLTDQLPRALGVRPGGRDVADAVVRGKIVRYDDTSQNYRPGDPQTGNPQIVGNEVQITVAIEIVDIQNNEILWESSGITGRGTYSPANGENDQVGKQLAIRSLVQQIIDGAQSQW